MLGAPAPLGGKTSEVEGEDGAVPVDSSPRKKTRTATDQYGVRGVHKVGWRGLDALALSSKQREVLVAEVVSAPSVRAGLSMLMQLSGMGGLRPNTVLLGFHEAWGGGGHRVAHLGAAAAGGVSVPITPSASGSDVAAHEGMIHDAFMAGMGVVVVRDRSCVFNDGITPIKGGSGARARGGGVLQGLSLRHSHSSGSAAAPPPPPKTIDLWWLSDEGGLAVLVAHLMQKNPQYAAHKLRVFTTGSPDAGYVTRACGGIWQCCGWWGSC
jgi:hypothetical protein